MNGYIGREKATFLVLVALAVGMLIVGLPAKFVDEEIPAPIEASTIMIGQWFDGPPPIGRPVVGAWILESGSIVYKDVLMTDYAGLYEWWGASQMSWPVEDPPDYWSARPILSEIENKNGR